jgi:ankyrin repeat protein
VSPNERLVHRLLRAGASKDSLLFDAVDAGIPNMVKLALGLAVDLNICHNISPLHRAVEGRHVDIVQMLLDHRADVQRRNRFEETPLHYAVISWQSEVGKGHFKEWRSIVQMLLRSGADYNASDNRGRDVLQCARMGGWVHTALQRLIMQHEDRKAASEQS